ncbi:MAG: hypothetical protein CMP19_10405 [Rickettsiales bacterium]|nr:hypothetical protein [Rickettsiales bacterium]
MKANLIVGHTAPRKKAYMPVGDQLDAIIKTFAYLQEQGVDLGEDGRELVEHSQWVKAKFAKK